MPPNIQRGFVVNAAELGTYDHSKEWLITSGIFREGVFAHTGASFIAGFAGAAASNPYVPSPSSLYALVSLAVAVGWCLMLSPRMFLI